MEGFHRVIGLPTRCLRARTKPTNVKAGTRIAGQKSNSMRLIVLTILQEAGSPNSAQRSPKGVEARAVAANSNHTRNTRYPQRGSGPLTKPHLFPTFEQTYDG